jgi:phage recombination protein Bet
MSRYNPKTNQRGGKNFSKVTSSSDNKQLREKEVNDIVTRSVLRSGLSYESFVKVLIQSALSRLSIWTQADLERLLMMAERLKLDPLNNEIYAIETQADSTKKSHIVLVVGIDGWSKVINSHPQFDGMRFIESEPGDDELPLYFECTIFRKDRKIATSVREYMYEVHTNQGAWLTHPRRMLRHKAMIQCARICFGLSGVYDPDEAKRITSTKSLTCVTIQNKGSEYPGTRNLNTASQPKTEQSNLGARFVKNWVKKHPGSLQTTPS